MATRVHAVAGLLSPISNPHSPISAGSTWADLAQARAPIHWDWPGWLPRGFLTILASQPGIGKSSLCLHLAAAHILTPTPPHPCTPAPSHSRSSLIAQVPRVVWTLNTPDPADPDNRRLSVIKNNLAPIPDPIGMRIDAHGLHFGPRPKPALRNSKGPQPFSPSRTAPLPSSRTSSPTVLYLPPTSKPPPAPPATPSAPSSAPKNTCASNPTRNPTNGPGNSPPTSPPAILGR